MGFISEYRNVTSGLNWNLNGEDDLLDHNLFSIESWFRCSPLEEDNHENQPLFALAVQFPVVLEGEGEAKKLLSWGREIFPGHEASCCCWDGVRTKVSCQGRLEGLEAWSAVCGYICHRAEVVESTRMGEYYYYYIYLYSTSYVHGDLQSVEKQGHLLK